MRIKRFLALLLAAMLLLGSLPASAAITDPTGACNHMHKKWVQYLEPAMSCLNDNVYREMCTDCGRYLDNYRRVRGPHTWGAWQVTRKATCIAEGEQVRRCDVCKERETKTIARTGHTAGVWTTVLEATCAAKGRQETKCVTCGTKMSREKATLPHTVSEWTVTTAPTCTKEGSRTGTCTVCGGTATEKVEAAGHSWDEGSNVHAPKCEASGYKDSTCTVCGAKQRVTLPAAGHSWGEWVVTAEPSGANRGKREHRCTVCNKRVSEYFYYEGTLAKGDKGEEVAGLNTMLDDLGYKSEKNSDNYTDKTRSGVNSFQKDAGLKQSGVADPDTLMKLNLDWQERFDVHKAIDTNWARIKDDFLKADTLRDHWKNIFPPHRVRTLWGPWRSNGKGQHSCTSIGAGETQYKIEDCTMTRIDLGDGRAMEICYLCGYKYMLLANGWKMILEDGVQYIDNGDDTHTVVVLDKNNPVEPYTEKHDLVAVGSLTCNEGGRLPIICTKCGCEDMLEYIDCEGYFAIEHQEPPVTEKRCGYTITYCGRCGMLYKLSAYTGNNCVYQTTLYKTEAELAAFEAMHPGSVTADTCYALDRGKCLYCGLEPNREEQQISAWNTYAHDYASLDGKVACVKCGKPCPEHESDKPHLLGATCEVCGLPFGSIGTCADDAHDWKTVATFTKDNVSPEIAGMLEGWAGYCCGLAQTCTKCGESSIAFDYDHNMVKHPNGDEFCTKCGEVEHRGLGDDAKGAPCQAGGSVLMTCKCCGQQVPWHPDDATVTHDFDDTVTETCSAIIRHCKRCGQDVYEEKEGSDCIFKIRETSDPYDIIAAGLDPEEICFVTYWSANCLICGAQDPYGTEDGLSAVSHHYQYIDGSFVCRHCGRQGTCGKDGHDEERQYYYDQASMEASPYNKGKVTWVPGETCRAYLYSTCRACGEATDVTGAGQAIGHEYLVKDGQMVCVYCGHVNDCQHELVNGWCKLCGWRAECADGEHLVTECFLDIAEMKNPGDYPGADVVTIKYCKLCLKVLEVIPEGHEFQPFSAEKHICTHCGLTEAHSYDNGVCTACGERKTACSHYYDTTRHQGDAELAAFDAKHPGVVQWDTCYVWEHGKCLLCGELNPNGSLWGALPHSFEFMNGRSVCLQCGKECAWHEAEAATGAEFCSYCGEPFQPRAECPDGQHQYTMSVKTWVYGNRMTAETAALAAEAGVSSFCRAELQLCDKCGKLRLKVLSYGHDMNTKPNGDWSCSVCGEVAHRGTDWNAGGAPCQSDGTSLMLCKCCGELVSVDVYPDSQTHDFEDKITETCEATIRHCKRCNQDVTFYKEGGQCSYITSVLKTPEALTAAGYDPAQVCRVEIVSQTCQVCGRDMHFSEPGPFVIPHYYEDVNGVLTCTSCGRTSTCSEDGHTGHYVVYHDQASFEASPYNIKQAKWYDGACYQGLWSTCTICGQVTPQTGEFYSAGHTDICKDGVLYCPNCGRVNNCQHEFVGGVCSLCGARAECADGEHHVMVYAFPKTQLNNPGDYPEGDVVVFTYCGLCRKLLDLTTEGHKMLPFTSDQHRCDTCGMTEYHHFAPQGGDEVCADCGETRHTNLDTDAHGAPCTPDGRTQLTCLNCGAKVTDFADAATMTHEFDTVTETCFATRKHCTRCGETVNLWKDGSCDNLKALLSTPEEISAAGFDPAYSCIVRVYGNCKICGAPPFEMADVSDMPHIYQSVNGKLVCKVCGRVSECAQAGHSYQTVVYKTKAAYEASPDAANGPAWTDSTCYIERDTVCIWCGHESDDKPFAVAHWKFAAADGQLTCLDCGAVIACTHEMVNGRCKLCGWCPECADGAHIPDKTELWDDDKYPEGYLSVTFCKVCKKVLAEEFKSLHIFEPWTPESHCCWSCKQVEAHSFENGVCTVCGWETGSALPDAEAQTAPEAGEEQAPQTEPESGEPCENCSYRVSFLSTPEQITAAGYDPKDVCMVHLYGTCTVCGAEPPAQEKEVPFYHLYKAADGKQVCAECGRVSDCAAENHLDATILYFDKAGFDAVANRNGAVWTEDTCFASVYGPCAACGQDTINTGYASVVPHDYHATEAGLTCSWCGAVKTCTHEMADGVCKLCGLHTPCAEGAHQPIRDTAYHRNAAGTDMDWENYEEITYCQVCNKLLTEEHAAVHRFYPSSPANHRCWTCNQVEPHSFADGVCTVCGWAAE